MLSESPESASLALRQFAELVEHCSGRDVLISAESLFMWLVGDQDPRRFFAFVEEIRALDRIRAVWTLRQVDEMIHSLYTMPGFLDSEVTDLARSMDSIDVMRGIAAMQAVEGVVDDVVYVKYENDGGHHSDLLHAFGIAPSVRLAIERDLSTSVRRNEGMSHKQLIALRNAEALSERTGVSIDRKTMKAVFADGFVFTDDHRYELVDAGARRHLHERMRAAARRRDFEPYLQFFGDAEVDDSVPRAGADLDYLGEDDVNRLLAHWRRLAAASQPA